MLRGLNIRNMLLIDKLDLEFQAGLNVLTGETGAGKSILLDSLGFVLGWRGRADMVRKGADLGEVSAWFELSATHPVRDILRDAGLPDEDDLLLRRTNTPDGRKTAYVNDRRCTGEILRQLSDCLLELHGQHDDRGLLDSKGHRALLDSYAGVDLSEVRSAWKQLTKLIKDIEAAKLELEAAERDADYVRHSVAELTELSPEVGEDDSLDARRRLMQAGARIREDISKAAQALGTDGAESMLSDANRWLEETANDAEGRLDEPLAALSRALNEVADAQRGVEDCLSQLDYDPMELEQVEERLFAIRALARKHKVLPDKLPALAADLEIKLNAIDTGATNIADLEQQRDKAQRTYDACAAALFEKRTTAGTELDKRMMQELAPLKMETAIFRTDVVAADAGPDGADNIAFTVSTNPGAPSGPINKIASGGELSRFLLALKVCLTSRTDGLTLIFDEIDRGVGGATADAVGRRLAALAAKGQVLVVTHSPQVAALGTHQWQVSKSTDGQETISSVVKLNETERTDEIARMLAGDVITDEARAAAQSLLNAL
ncbi:DNA repair protein RecN [Amylibacter sp. SFDW26]|uniref:DNA repair protein RecN n=1 Tax=Amylibacter sp. SFDW26 TaxID=2652722 RepID=UPI001262859D|nr:DNA repair protein RecN [Amylibacter sp. SFDW26]KAB7610327.1 DNA repair protein RecN [Amylibacter sp. SFDW26]